MQTLTLNTGTLSRDRLAVVQNVDPQVVEIVLTTPHVAVYVFQQGRNQWDRKNIEGPLYLVRRAARPEFSLLILNRKGPNHMSELITEHHEFNNQDPYIIFRNARAPQPLPHGMWFKSAEDRGKLWTAIQKIKLRLSGMGAGAGGGGGSGNGQAAGGGAAAAAPAAPSAPIAGLTADQVELSQVQLQKLLIRMVQDERFVGLLHKQYVASLRKRRAAASQ
jgi:hypothetical protein